VQEERPLVLSRLGLLFTLTLLVLVFFWPLVLHPDQTLYGFSSDLLAEHIPAKRFLVRSYQQTGELPLWCPLQFCGAPFVHDIQVALFYPPHLLLLALPEDQVGPALSWLIVAHLWLAGLLMFVYARHRGLRPLPALVAGIGFMFGPKWLLHLLGGGHYITVGLAWLPLVLLGLERAISRRSLLWATIGGTAYALILLSTHPQWTFYAGVFTALWTLSVALQQAGYLGGEGPRSRSRLFRALGLWIGCGLWLVVVALVLAAVQVLPTLEAARHSTRAGGIGAESLAESFRAFLLLVGPALTRDVPYLMWEDRGGFALLWLIAAVLAPLLRGGAVRYQAGVFLGMLLFAWFGALLGRVLPGFHLFRQHPRVLVIAALPVAYLAGVTTQALFLEGELSLRLRRLCAVVALALAAYASLTSGGAALWHLQKGQSLDAGVLYWALMPVLFVLALRLLWRGPRHHPRLTALVWALLLLADAWALTWPMVEVRPEQEVYRPSPCVRYLMGHRGQGRVLDEYYYDEDENWIGSPLGQGAPLALVHNLEAVRGYNPLDVHRFREFLGFIEDRDEPLVAINGALTDPVLGPFKINNPTLLDLLGVRYLLAPTAAPPGHKGWKAVHTDPGPVAYNIAEGGMQKFPSYTVFERTNPFPRAFLVPEAEPLPPRSDVLAVLKRTDFRKRVLLEGHEPTTAPKGEPADIPQNGKDQEVFLIAHEANRVALRVSTRNPGFLVLTDVWYPGWTATMDGEPVPVYRANYTFRAVDVPSGTHTVVFRFEPASYRTGRRISLVSLALLPFFLLALGLWEWRRGRAD
jgi:Bacterial membrane protein YfhO